jgi:stress response protein YsnF
VLAVNQDFQRPGSISVLLEEVEVRQQGIQVAETEGAAEVVRRELKVLAELLVLAL